MHIFDRNKLTLKDLAENELETNLISQLTVVDYLASRELITMVGIDGLRFSFLNVTGNYSALKLQSHPTTKFNFP